MYVITNIYKHLSPELHDFLFKVNLRVKHTSFLVIVKSFTHQLNTHAYMLGGL